jgi:hypothetical protein
MREYRRQGDDCGLKKDVQKKCSFVLFFPLLLFALFASAVVGQWSGICSADL